MGTLLLHRVIRWSCPNCAQTAVTREAAPHSRFHSCPGLFGLSAPLTEDGADVVVEAVARADYEGADHGATQLGDDGRPYMSVITRYGDGRQDCAVLAPYARREAR